MFYIQSFIIITIIISIIKCDLPKDLSCNKIIHRSNYTLEDCNFINKTDIECHLYAIARNELRYLPVSAVIKFTIILYLKNETILDYTQTWWCLGIRSSRLTMVDELPPTARNSYDLPAEVATLLTTIKKSGAYAEFYGDAAAGFLQLREDCKYSEEIQLSSNCIKNLVGSSYAFAPRSEELPGPFDIFDEVMDLYFDRMKGRVKMLTLKTENKGLDASKWMEYLFKLRLEKLDASNNYFDNIQFHGFLPHRLHQMNDLKYLYLKDCKISGINKGNFYDAPNLIHLDISENKLSRTPDGIRLLKKIEILNMSMKKNQADVSYFDLGNELTTLNNLKILHLSGIPLFNISRSSLPKSKQLEYLDLSYCKLTHIENDTFFDLKSLKYINLGGNHLNFLHPKTFIKLVPMSTILLFSNKFNNGQKLIFQNNINILDFSQNNIKFPKNILNKGKINILNLSNNLIANWTLKNIFNSNDYNIQNLNISSNKLTVINKKMGESLNNIDNLDIGNNPFQCQDCALLEFQDFINNTTTNILSLNKTEPIKCYSPLYKNDINIMDAVYNATLCEIIPPNFLLIIGLPLSVILTISLATVLLLYIYRFEVTYMKHLLNVRKKNRKYEEKYGCLYDAFVSYCGKDREWVLKVLLPGLENDSDNYVLCLHERDFKLGTYIMDNVVSCIDQSRRVILIISNNYIESQWCKWELQMAQHRIFEDCKDFLILVELEKVERENIPLHLRMLMTSRTYLEWPQSGGDNLVNQTTFWSRLKSALGAGIAHIEVEAQRQREEEKLAAEEEDDEEYFASLVPLQPVDNIDI